MIIASAHTHTHTDRLLSSLHFLISSGVVAFRKFGSVWTCNRGGGAGGGGKVGGRGYEEEGTIPHCRMLPDQFRQSSKIANVTLEEPYKQIHGRHSKPSTSDLHMRFQMSLVRLFRLVRTLTSATFVYLTS